MDTVSKIVRSRIMASVGTKNTGPELFLRKALHRRGLRFRLCRPDLPGRPDIVFPRYRTAVFVHGCFWHSHGCKLSTMPSSRKEFWKTKFRQNRDRDQRVVKELRRSGWRVITVWQCQIGNKGQSAEAMARRIEKKLRRINPQHTTTP
jgi:DNA mismatch endonuclease, patch repair protein